MLPALLLCVLFFLLAWWLYRSRIKYWFALPLITGLLILVFTVALKLDDVNHVQAANDIEVLLAESTSPDLFVKSPLNNQDATLLMASLTSKALLQARPLFSERNTSIDSVLNLLANYATDKKLHRQWQRGANWDREVFFLAHAGAILGHYQLATGLDTYADSFKAIGEHLGNRTNRSRYKHLLSREDEDFYRPADNAAALYTLSLYDKLNGTNLTERNFKDWTDYLANELYFAESRLPCSAFSETQRCHLEPTATTTGLYIAYRAAARPAAIDNDIPWREWLHYFGNVSLSPFSLTIRPNVRDGREARFCDLGAYPLTCDQYEQAVGLWAAAAYGGDYTYFRLYSTSVLDRWFFEPLNYQAYRPLLRVQALTKVALRAIGETS